MHRNRPAARYWLQNYRFSVARAFIGGKLPVFGEPRTRRRFSEKYHAVSEKSLLDAGIIWSGRWASIVLALPKPDGALVESERCREVSLCHACERSRRAHDPESIYHWHRLDDRISTRLDNRPPNLEELTHLCVVALQLYYDGKCPEECLEARARDFAAWHLARLGHDPPAGQRE
jgi:hypothetical protein